jgi:hypothetical protein
VTPAPPRRLTERQFWQRAAKQAKRGVCIVAGDLCVRDKITHKQHEAIESRMEPLVNKNRTELGGWHGFAFEKSADRKAYCLRQMRLCMSKSRRARWQRLGKG